MSHIKRLALNDLIWTPSDCCSIFIILEYALNGQKSGSLELEEVMKEIQDTFPPDSQASRGQYIPTRLTETVWLLFTSYCGGRGGVIGADPVPIGIMLLLFQVPVM